VILRNDHLTGNTLLGAGAVHHITFKLMHRNIGANRKTASRGGLSEIGCDMF
jgi:hypothetical protein